jgi:hypothetical protein
MDPDSYRLLRFYPQGPHRRFSQRWERIHGRPIQRAGRAIPGPSVGDSVLEYGRCPLPASVRTGCREHWLHAWIFRHIHCFRNLPHSIGFRSEVCNPCHHLSSHDLSVEEHRL